MKCETKRKRDGNWWTSGEKEIAVESRIANSPSERICIAYVCLHGINANKFKENEGKTYNKECNLRAAFEHRSNVVNEQNIHEIMTLIVEVHMNKIIVYVWREQQIAKRRKRKKNKRDNSMHT